MSSTTPKIEISPVDVENLPSLSDLTGGDLNELFRQEFARVTQNIEDERTDPTVERTVFFKLDFTPDADSRSAKCDVKRCGSTLVSGKMPKPTRIVFTRKGGSIQTRVLVKEGREGVALQSKRHEFVEADSMPDPDEILNGRLLMVFKRELVKVLINIDDPREEIDHVRSIAMKVAIRADEDRLAYTVRLAGVSTKLSRSRLPKAETYYPERSARGAIVLADEPAADIPGPDGQPTIARQSRVGSDAEAN